MTTNIKVITVKNMGKIFIIFSVLSLFFYLFIFNTFNVSEMFLMLQVVPKYPKAVSWYPNFGANGPISDQPNQRQRWEIITQIKKDDTFQNFVSYYNSVLTSTGWQLTYNNGSTPIYEKKTKDGIDQIAISNWPAWQDHTPIIDFSHFNQADLSEQMIINLRYKDRKFWP